jgi:hypothetical protein
MFTIRLTERASRLPAKISSGHYYSVDTVGQSGGPSENQKLFTRWYCPPDMSGLRKKVRFSLVSTPDTYMGTLLRPSDFQLTIKFKQNSAEAVDAVLHCVILFIYVFV